MYHLATRRAVVAAAVATYPSVIGMANLMGRAAWGPVSDRLGCGTALAMMGIQFPALLAMPAATSLLAADPAAPAHFEAFGAKEKIVSLELAAAGAPGRDEPGQHLMCLGYDDGRVDVHAIAPEFARITPEEVRALEAMLA